MIEYQLSVILIMEMFDLYPFDNKGYRFKKSISCRIGQKLNWKWLHTWTDESKMVYMNADAFVRTFSRSHVFPLYIYSSKTVAALLIEIIDYFQNFKIVALINQSCFHIVNLSDFIKECK